ncbi:MAG: GNAT family N-acetyltransferase [Gammaproteobacteria bacterium]|jgi:GNAT superfamily N-acetyltransferase|nr:GNAT family N-acetyltransferase [Gammaproteobacteria bacterium]|tara:strand:- start:201 stop:650 length:450 start_codon:yes stop_codon:yes gene_type:complete
MIEIREARPEEVPVIAEFNQAMALETENKHLDGKVILAGVTRMIQDRELGFYLVALIEDDIAGCLGITTEWSDWRDGLFWWVQSVYVSPEFRGKGVFSKLYQRVKELAKRDKGICGIRLYAEKENERAIRTYRRLGMSVTDYRLLEELF